MFIDSIRPYLNTGQGKRNSTLFLFILVGVLCLLLSVNKPLGDYANYYYGSTFFVNKVPVAEIYEPIFFNQLIRTAGEEEVFANYAPVPPFSLLFYLPFTGLEAELSKFIFGLLGLWLCTISLYRLLQRYPVKNYGILLLPLLVFFPLKSNLFLGQSYLYITCFLIEGFIFSNKEKGALVSALFFSLTIALKLFPGIVLIYLWFSGKRKAFLYTLVFTSFLFIACIPVVGIEQMLTYTTESLPRLFNGEINDPYSSSYQSVAVLLKKLFVPDLLLNPHALWQAAFIHQLLNLCYSAAVLTFCIQVCRSSAYDQLFKFSVILFGGLLISGYGASYTLLLLVCLFIAWANQNQELDRRFYLFIALLLFISAIPIHLFFGQPVFLQFPRLYAMLLLFACLIYFYKLSFRIPLFAGIVVILSLPVVLKLTEEKDASEYYNASAPSLLLYDYYPKQNGIVIKYYDDQGEHEYFYKTKDSLRKDHDLTLSQGHVYYKGQALTQGHCNNKSPMLLNKQEVIYLSDKNRGIGLYTLRKIKLPDESAQ